MAIQAEAVAEIRKIDSTGIRVSSDAQLHFRAHE